MQQKRLKGGCAKAPEQDRVAQQHPLVFLAARAFLEVLFFDTSTVTGSTASTTSAGAGAIIASTSSGASAPPCSSLAKTSGETLTRVKAACGTSYSYTIPEGSVYTCTSGCA